MKTTLVILLILLLFWSLLTTFKAIFLILTKDFKGNKTSWILIVMIGIIGPILWITKGEKMISKTKSEI
jgi:hypothetical protein